MAPTYTSHSYWSSSPPPHGAKGPDEDAGVERETGVPHVEELEELALAVGPGGVVSLGDLPPAGDAGPAGEELAAGVSELVGLRERHGPGPDHGEVAQKHVQELRHLVEGGLSQQATQARDARVTVDLLLSLPLGHLGLVEVALGALVGVGVHGPELEDADRLPVKPHALLAEDRSSWGVQADGGADEGDGDGAHHARDAGEGDVEGALGGAVGEPSPPGRGDGRVGGRGDEGSRRAAIGGCGCHVLLATLCFFS